MSLAQTTVAPELFGLFSIGKNTSITESPKGYDDSKKKLIFIPRVRGSKGKGKPVFVHYKKHREIEENPIASTIQNTTEVEQPVVWGHLPKTYRLRP